MHKDSTSLYQSNLAGTDPEPSRIACETNIWEQNNNRYLVSFAFLKFRVFKFILVKQAALKQLVDYLCITH